MNSPRPEVWERVVRDRARALQRNLLSLRQWVDAAGDDDPRESEAVFELLARPTLKALDEITFRDLPLARLLDRADVVLHVEGDAISHTDLVRVSLLSRLMTNTQQSLVRVVRELAREFSVRPQEFPDLSFVGTAPGSLYLGFAIPRETERGELPGVAAADVETTAAKALRLLSIGSRAVAEEATLDRLMADLPDPRVRDAVLASVHQLAPGQGSGVRLVELSGQGVPKAALTAKTRQSSRLLLKDTATQARVRSTYVGVVREIDFDEKRFELRYIEGIGSIRCVYETDDDEKAVKWANARVVVRGMVELDRQGRPALMWTSSVDPEEDQRQDPPTAPRVGA